MYFSVLIFDLTTKNNKPTLYTTKNLTTAHERRAMKCHDLTSIVVPLQSKWPADHQTIPEKVIAARTKGLGWLRRRIETDVAPTSSSVVSRRSRTFCLTSHRRLLSVPLPMQVRNSFIDFQGKELPRAFSWYACTSGPSQLFRTLLLCCSLTI